MVCIMAQLKTKYNELNNKKKTKKTAYDKNLHQKYCRLLATNFRVSRYVNEFTMALSIREE